MNTKVMSHNKRIYLECLPGESRIASEADVLDLVAACGEHDTYRLLLHGENFTEDFFQLRSGLAGAVLLKLGNYSIRTAAVIPNEQIGEGRFYEMVLELNRGNEFRVFSDRDAAVEWLTAY